MTEAPAKKRRKASISPTKRALADLRDMGYLAAILERWNPFAKVRQDVFGCVDILACYAGVGILGIQVTSGSNHAARREKAIAEPRLRAWLMAGGRFEIWSYAKQGARGDRKLWVLRREEILWQTLNGCTGADNVDAIVANHGTWAEHRAKEIAEAKAQAKKCFEPSGMFKQKIVRVRVTEIPPRKRRRKVKK